MAGSKANYLENRVLGSALRAQAFTGPTDVYVALYTSDPTETGAAGTEVSGGSYARQRMAFDVESGGVTQNTSTVSFPQATASWGTVSHFALLDASSGGNTLYYGSFDASKPIGIGDTAEIAAGALVVTED